MILSAVRTHSTIYKWGWYNSIHQIIEIDNGPLDMFDEVLKPLVEGMIEEFVEIDKKGFRIKTKKCRGFWESMCQSCKGCN
jgi:hypothetical protein